jgi:hypothetical protein
MSFKRDFLGRIFSNGVPFAVAVNNKAVFVRMRREKFSSCPADWKTKDATFLVRFGIPLGAS